MTARPMSVSKKTRQDQSRAADPHTSAWVSAHAGSGKTHVLANRVIRLLLSGADPGRILCLTYTRAAAGEMKARIFATLGAWAVMPDAGLAEAVGRLEDRPPDPERLREARRLFARALETPGGLKIQTIHAFCEAVLRRFPLEANIAGHFELADAPRSAALIADARRALLSGLDREDRPRISAAFARVVGRVQEAGLEKLLAAIVERRDELRDFIDAVRGGGDYDDYFRHFGFRPDTDPATLQVHLWPDPWFDRACAERIHAAGGKEAQKFADGLSRLLASRDVGERMAIARGMFLKVDGEPKSPGRVATKAITAVLPDIAEQFDRKAAEVRAAADRLATLDMVRDSVAAFTLADAMLAHYERRKAASGLLDFNDLIHRTARLLQRRDAAQWVQYKLDRGIDHLLVDEAQDTSPSQWKVIGGLVGEFFAGEGARPNVARTLFAVGDEKQSIYSFQGADPAAFAEERERYRLAAGGARRPFEKVGLDQSFRSAAPVLGFVDEVFRDPAALQGLTRDEEPFGHDTVRKGAPGVVELWPSLAAEKASPADDWREAVDHATAPEVRLARAVADTIGAWLAEGAVIEGKKGVPRRMQPGDIIVLVRKRDRFMHALSRALKEHDPQIPAAGVDRLVLSGHIAVKDLIALARISLQPHDDLSLAAVLKSPVFSLDEDALFRLAADRTGSLWDALMAMAAREPALAPVAGRLRQWRMEAVTRPPFEFFSGVLGRDGVRRAMQARLGPEAAEILDTFLAHVLAAETAGPGGLEALLAALETAAPEVSRAQGSGRDEVRIMTAHASKGLEAPVVFLVDPGTDPAGSSHPPVLMRFDWPEAGPPLDGFVWNTGAKMRNDWRKRLEVALKQAAAEEYRRLLYVGLTRAEDRLVICGYHGEKSKEGRWHHLAAAAMDRLAGQSGEPVATLAHPPLGADIRRYGRPAVPSGPAARAAVASGPAVPDWLARQLPPEPAPPRPLAPSGLALMIEPPAGPGASVSPLAAGAEPPSFAIRRGEIVHRLLQQLPGLPAADRPAAAARYLSRAASDWPEPLRAATADAALAILSDPAFASVFAPGSLAEAAVQGVLRLGGRDRPVTGKIDRLAIGAREILIVDYKTGRPPLPGASPDPAHVAQLALYGALIAPIYPGRSVRAALLHVGAPLMVEIEAEAMQETLRRIDAACRTS